MSNMKEGRKGRDHELLGIHAHMVHCMFSYAGNQSKLGDESKSCMGEQILHLNFLHSSAASPGTL